MGPISSLDPWHMHRQRGEIPTSDSNADLASWSTGHPSSPTRSLLRKRVVDNSATTRSSEIEIAISRELELERNHDHV